MRHFKDICGSTLKAEQMWMQFTAAWGVTHFAEHYHASTQYSNNVIITE